MRVTRLDTCCNPPAPATACSVVTTAGFISVAYAKNVADPTEIEVRRADGTICISDLGCAEMKWLDLTITLCQVDPDLINLMTGSPLAMNFDGDKVGFGDIEEVNCENNFSLEVWSDIPTQICAPGSVKSYGYWLTPCVTSAVLGDVTVENDAASFVITARTKAGSAWDVGPYGVDAADAINTPGPLITPIAPTEHRRVQLVTVPPPTPVCGCVAMPAALP